VTGASTRIQVWASLTVAVIVTTGLSPVAAAAAGPPTAQDADEVPERWIVGEQVYEDADVTLDERLRVLPGARLVVDASTLTFEDQPTGPTGIVAEPGSEVHIRSSELRSATEPGAFTLHLAGQAHVTDATIDGARDVVLQPRPVASSLLEPLREHAEGSVPGFDAARAATMPNQTLDTTTVANPVGAGVRVGIPTDTGDLARGSPVTIRGSTLAGDAAPALACYETHAHEDPPDESPTTRLVVEDTHLQRAHGAVVRCPPSPTATPMPDRNPPAALPAEIPVPPIAADTHDPHATPGPDRLQLLGGALTGQGTGIALDGTTDVDVAGTTFASLHTGLHLAAAGQTANVTDPRGVDLATGIHVATGTLSLEGGHLAGRHAGVRADAGGVTVQGTTFAGFATGLDVDTEATVTDVAVRDADRCVRLGAPASLTGATLTGCRVAILLAATSGATVRDNKIREAEHALHVATPDAEGHPEHYDHEVEANTVDGEALAYVHDANGTQVAERAGSAHVAHSSQVRVAKLDPTIGHHHVAASEDVVVGAPTDQQRELAALHDEGLAETFHDVWRGVDFEQYPGALKGPQGTLEQGSANALDQAWTLTNRTRDLGYQARLVEGSLDVPRQAFLDWTGFTDLGQATTVLGFEGHVGPDTVHVDHDWVEVRVGEGVWYQLDPAFEQYRWIDPPDYENLTDLDSDRFYDPYVENVTIGDHWAKDIPWQQWRNETREGQNRTVDALGDTTDPVELAGGRRPTPVDSTEEPTREPEDRRRRVPVDEQWSVEIRTEDPRADTQGEIGFQATTPFVYGDRITLKGTPSTEEDLRKVREAGGLDEVDRTTVEYTTSLWVGDRMVDLDGKWETPTGPEVREERSLTRHPGDRLRLAVDMRAPGNETVTTATTPVRVGGTYGIVLDVGQTPGERVDAVADAWNESMAALTNGTDRSVNDVTGQLHHLTGTAYFHQVDARSALAARIQGVQDQPLLGTAVTGQHVVPFVNGTEENLAHTAPFIDVQDLANAYPEDGNRSRLFAYNFASGMLASQWEHRIFGQLWNLPATSTIKVLSAANAEGQRLYQINATNADDVLPQLDLPQGAQTQIRNAIQRGQTVIAPETEVTYHNWTGTAWATLDTDTGRSGWLLYGSPADPLNADVAPVTLQGGSGALIEGTNSSGCLAWEGCAYDDRKTVLTWSKKGVALFGHGAKSIKHVYANDVDVTADALRYGYALDIEVDDQATRLLRHTAKHEDSVVPTAKSLAKNAGHAGTVLDVAINFNDVFLNPDDQGDLTAQTGEFVGRTAYDVGTGTLVAGATIKAAGAGAALCGAAAGVGAVVCGAGAGIGTALAGGWATGKVKKWIFG